MGDVPGAALGQVPGRPGCRAWVRCLAGLMPPRVRGGAGLSAAQGQVLGRPRCGEATSLLGARGGAVAVTRFYPAHG